MATIRDIAKMSGYSVTTVSRALNGSEYISEKAMNKITQIMKEMDYIPNLVARELSLDMTKKVGVVLPDTNHPYYSDRNISVL